MSGMGYLTGGTRLVLAHICFLQCFQFSHMPGGQHRSAYRSQCMWSCIVYDTASPITVTGDSAFPTFREEFVDAWLAPILPRKRILRGRAMDFRV